MRVVLAVLVCGLLLEGCPGLPGRERVTDVDRMRLQVMLDEPIIRDGERILGQRPGTLLDPDLGWDRGYAAATLFAAVPDRGDRPVSPVSPEEAERRTADALGALRATGWTVLSASCEVPRRDRIEASTLPSAEPGEVGTDPADDEWSWSATAYKHVDGMSYWARLAGRAVRTGLAGVSIRLRAPNVDDPADLFTDRPPGLPAGSTCIEEPGVPPIDVEQGTLVEVEERHSGFGGRSPNSPDQR